MTINKQVFVQDKYSNTDEWKLVSGIATTLYDYLSQPYVTKKIDAVNVPKVSSKEVQDVLLEKALEIGFKDESKGLFKNYPSKGLRPDFYLPIPSGKTGIIIEVERGRTNQNNMDFLDFWKCHICDVAHYLFLFVPNELVQNTSGKISGHPFNTVTQHMVPLFEKQNYTNVRGLVVVGY